MKGRVDVYATEKISPRKIKAFRAMVDLNQREIAKRMGMCLNAYQSKENGYIDFKAAEIKKLAQIFDVSMEDMYTAETTIKIKEEA